MTEATYIHRGGEASGVREAWPVVVEELEVEVSAADRAAYIARDRETWTAFLRGCEGFVRKEVWAPAERPDVLVIQIWWTSRADWKRVTPAAVAEIDARLGDLLRPVVCREYEVVDP